MADIYGSAYNDPSVKPAPLIDVARNHGKVRHVVSVATVAAANGINDKVYFAKVPSHAVMSLLSQIDHAAITGLTDFDLGGANAPDALVNGADLVTAGAGTKSAMSAVSLANAGKRLWELLGYASDPGGDLTLFGTLKADPSAGGTIVLSLLYAVD